MTFGPSAPDYDGPYAPHPPEPQQDETFTGSFPAGTTSEAYRPREPYAGYPRPDGHTFYSDIYGFPPGGYAARYGATNTAAATNINNIRIGGGGRPFNHTLHLILTLLTCGLWAPIWLVMWMIHPKS